MSSAADLLVDRRSLRRKLTFWRVVTVVTVLVALVGIGLSLGGSALRTGAPHIARIEVSGLITGKQETLDVLKRVERSSAKAVVLRINSGGGTTAGSEALYNAVRRLSDKKPVVAVIDGIGASGAYMTALGADRILANGSAIVGSIGVIAQYPNLVKLLETVGVKVEAVRSSPLKAMPSGVEPTPPEARAALEATVRESYHWFRGLVGERRKLEGAALDQISDGRVFTGRQAIGLGLIDAIGDEADALAWLAKEKSIAAGLPVRTYRPASANSPFRGLTALTILAQKLGLPLSQGIEEAGERLLGPNVLDGLVSVWHPHQQ